MDEDKEVLDEPSTLADLFISMMRKVPTFGLIKNLKGTEGHLYANSDSIPYSATFFSHKPIIRKLSSMSMSSYELVRHANFWPYTLPLVAGD